MKGIVFTEFLDMVESKFSLDMVDQIIEKSNLESGGIYTAIGTYDHQEMVSLVTELHKATEIPVSELMNIYGQHVFGQFHKGYPMLFENVNDAFSLLESVHGYIHIEVLKLYPDAELPAFKTERINDTHLKMYYSSERAMGDFANGLILGCLEHYGEKGNVEMTRLNEKNTEILFDIKLI